MFSEYKVTNIYYAEDDFAKNLYCNKEKYG